MPNFALRRDALRRLLHTNSLPAFLVTDELNVSYLTGFRGDSSYLLVTQLAERDSPSRDLATLAVDSGRC